MKKILSIFAVAVVFMIAGCNKDTSSTTASDSTSTTAGTTSNIDTQITGDVNITFWDAFGKDKEDILAGLIKNFTDANPKIHVDLLSQGDYDGLRTKVVQSIVSGDTPTMLIGYPDHIADYLTGNGVISLDPYINNPTVGLTQDQLNDFVPAYLEENQQFGKTYGLPFNKSTEVLIYNKTYFDDHDLTVPTTWAQTQAVAQQIHDDTGAWGLSYDSAANLFITMTRQWGGQYTNSNGDLLFDNAQSIAAMKYYQQEHDAGLFTLPAEWEQSYSSTPFIAQQVYMTVGSTAGIAYNVPSNGAFDIGVAPIPQKADGTPAVIQQGTNISIMSSADSQQRLAAWLLTKYLTSKEATITWAEKTGYLPVRTSALNDTDYQNFLNNPSDSDKYVAMAEKAAFEQVDSMYYDPAFVGSSNARNQVQIIVQNIMFNQQDPKSAIEDGIYTLTQ